MSDSQRFPVAAHALAYLAHKGAFSAADAAPSAVLAASIPTNPVVVRRDRGGQHRARRGFGRRVGALVGQIGQGVGGDGKSLAVGHGVVPKIG